MQRILLCRRHLQHSSTVSTCDTIAAEPLYTALPRCFYKVGALETGLKSLGLHVSIDAGGGGYAFRLPLCTGRSWDTQVQGGVVM